MKFDQHIARKLLRENHLNLQVSGSKQYDIDGIEFWIYPLLDDKLPTHLNLLPEISLYKDNAYYRIGDGGEWKRIF
jgi:hypothetical protein